MDDRQTQIREGAGLEDSRVNEEFLDFLNKWSTPVLITLAVAALVWAGMQKLHQRKVARIDQAFSELNAATEGGNPSPASLKTLANEYTGVRSVSALALLTTTNLYLNAFVVGIEPGAALDPQTGQPTNASDVLNEDQRQVYLEQAGQLAQQVLDLTGGVEGKELLAMEAMCRLAAVDEGKRDFDAAKKMYDRIESLSKASQFIAIENFAKERLANLDQVKDMVPLPAQDTLVPLPGEDTPALTQEQIQKLLDSVPKDDGKMPAIPGASGDSTDGTTPTPEPTPAPTPDADPDQTPDAP